MGSGTEEIEIRQSLKSWLKDGCVTSAKWREKMSRPIAEKR
jgi:hypothetical protein